MFDKNPCCKYAANAKEIIYTSIIFILVYPPVCYNKFNFGWATYLRFSFRFYLLYIIPQNASKKIPRQTQHGVCVFVIFIFLFRFLSGFKRFILSICCTAGLLQRNARWGTLFDWHCYLYNRQQREITKVGSLSVPVGGNFGSNNARLPE